MILDFQHIIGELEQTMAAEYAGRLKIEPINACAGGDINQCYHARLSRDNETSDVFIKLNTSEHKAVLETEKQNLEYLSAILTARRSPEVIYYTKLENCHALVLNYLELKSRLKQGDFGKVAALVSDLHRHSHQSFGWYYDNHIGYSHQANKWASSWAKFWLEQRFAPQWQRALANTCSKSDNSKLKLLEGPLVKHIEQGLRTHQPTPSLCHGDLWIGNAGVIRSGTAVLFDPACYYGDPETDLAMAKLFGGFTSEFFDAYHVVHPKKAGHEQRLDIYQLYHLLNHYNMFGSTYLESVLTSCRKILHND